ncbi:MAG: two-component system regulatory protein YycI [Gemella sp.]|nr:two-component system regulatory protein YycI [Gemella sp.]
MEWGRIKTMFIYLFAVLNLILIAAYFYLDYQNKSERYEEKQAIINSIKNDNIIVENFTINKEKLARVSSTIKRFSIDTLPKSQQYSYSLESEGNSEKLEIKFNTPLTNVNNENFKESIVNFITTAVGKSDEYVFEEYSISDKKITYRQAVAGLPIYNNSRASLIFDVDNKGDVVSATKTALVNTKLGEEQTIVPYSQVVQKLYHENMIAKNSKVDVDLGYYTYVSDVENQVLIPTWEIRVMTEEKEKTYYVDAYNMKIVNN